ncbi:hypothetical protein BUE80_DR000963 [Diplocarpon rosae]|nr:hypothetical protein BUE80_DR000963 [Diplocarpon rosae]
MAPRSIFQRQRTPLLIGTFFGATAIFGGLKWKAVFSRSEAAKKASTKENCNYSVAPGRSGGGV